MPRAPRESLRARRLRVLNETDEERAARLAAQRPAPKRRLPRAARRVVDISGASQTWRDEKAAQADLARLNHVRALIETTCSAAVFDPQAAKALVSRDLYADACRVLANAIGWPANSEHPHVLLWLRQSNLLAFQLATAFDIPEVTSWGTATERITTDWLRERAPSCERSRICLALMGEADWLSASPRERAGYLLHHVVEARR